MKKLPLLAALAVSLSCSPTSKPIDQGEIILHQLTDVVVVGTYQRLAEAGLHLQQLAQNTPVPTEESVSQLKEAWKDARTFWEQTEGFLFGPVDFEEIDPALDSWPLDQTSIDEYLNSSDTIDQDGLLRNPEARGFHLLEYLLWGSDGQKKIQDFTSREWTLLQVAAADFAQNTQKLVDAWTVGDEAFGLLVKQPNNATYDQAKSVYLEFAEGMAGIAAEMVESKMGGPFNEEGGVPLPQEQESYYSDQSKGDLINNLISIRNVFNGTTDGAIGNGLVALVAEQEPTLDQKFRPLWQSAFNAVNQLPASFTEAITHHREEVKAAQKEVAALHSFLENELVGFFSNK
jgi:putative iron-regulated protein